LPRGVNGYLVGKGAWDNDNAIRIAHDNIAWEDGDTSAAYRHVHIGSVVLYEIERGTRTITEDRKSHGSDCRTVPHRAIRHQTGRATYF
jgi:hypothetical protein